MKGGAPWNQIVEIDLLGLLPQRFSLLYRHHLGAKLSYGGTFRNTGRRIIRVIHRHDVPVRVDGRLAARVIRLTPLLDEAIIGGAREDVQGLRNSVAAVVARRNDAIACITRIIEAFAGSIGDPGLVVVIPGDPAHDAVA
jgi:hypothetical protein